MCEGYKIHLDFGYEDINGTRKLVLIPVITKCPEDPGPIIAATFLSIIFVTSFILNLMVVVTIATSYTLKRFLYCHLVVNLSVTCMIDCFLNISVAIGYVTTAPWLFGYYLSYFNSFTINMLNSEMAFAVMLLAIDRIAAAKKCTKYLEMSKHKLGILICLTWVVAFAMALPLICGLIMSMPYRNRYSCAVTDPNDDYYLIIHVILVLVSSTIVMIVLVIVTSVVFHKERKKQKRIKGNQTLGYFDQILMTPYYRTEFYPTLFVSLAVIFYLLCWLPFTAVSTVGPMVTKHWANETEEEQKEDDTFNRYIPVQRNGFRMTRAMLDESQLQKLNHTNITSSEVNTTNIDVHPGLIPEIIDTPAYEIAFIWLRFVYDLIVPILVFVVLRDVRAKSEGLIMCCRPNSVNVASPKPIRSYLNKSNKSATENKENSYKSQKKNSKNAVGFKTPILFATSEGLHIRTVEETYLDMIENKSLMVFAKQYNDTPRFTYDLCDVMLGYEDLTDFDGQFHIDDHDDNEKEPRKADIGAANHIVNNASRAAIGQKPLQEPLDDDSEDVPMKGEVRPPTPPKVHIRGNDPAISFGDTIEPRNDANRRQKGKKYVRFAPVLTEEIPRPDTGESSVLNLSINSARSSDSGILADNERSSAKGTEEARQSKPVPVKERKNIARKGPGNLTKRLQGKSKKSKDPRKPLGSRVRNIKSRHFSKIDASLASTSDDKSPPLPRRFSKPSAHR